MSTGKISGLTLNDGAGVPTTLDLGSAHYEFMPERRKVRGLDHAAPAADFSISGVWHASPEMEADWLFGSRRNWHETTYRLEYTTERGTLELLLRAGKPVLPRYTGTRRQRRAKRAAEWREVCRIAGGEPTWRGWRPAPGATLEGK